MSTGTSAAAESPSSVRCSSVPAGRPLKVLDNFQGWGNRIGWWLTTAALGEALNREAVYTGWHGAPKTAGGRNYDYSEVRRLVRFPRILRFLEDVVESNRTAGTWRWRGGRRVANVHNSAASAASADFPALMARSIQTLSGGVFKAAFRALDADEIPYHPKPCTPLHDQPNEASRLEELLVHELHVPGLPPVLCTRPCAPPPLRCCCCCSRIGADVNDYIPEPAWEMVQGWARRKLLHLPSCLTRAAFLRAWRHVGMQLGPAADEERCLPERKRCVQHERVCIIYAGVCTLSYSRPRLLPPTLEHASHLRAFALSWTSAVTSCFTFVGATRRPTPLATAARTYVPTARAANSSGAGRRAREQRGGRGVVLPRPPPPTFSWRSARGWRCVGSLSRRPRCHGWSSPTVRPRRTRRVSG